MVFAHRTILLGLQCFITRPTFCSTINSHSQGCQIGLQAVGVYSWNRGSSTSRIDPRGQGKMFQDCIEEGISEQAVLGPGTRTRFAGEDDQHSDRLASQPAVCLSRFGNCHTVRNGSFPFLSSTARIGHLVNCAFRSILISKGEQFQFGNQPRGKARRYL